MKLKNSVNALRCAIALAAGLLPATAEATPVTVDFNMPGWTANDAAGLFGTSATLAITSDNGNSSDLSQTYENSQITGLSVNAVGGTLSDTFTSADVTVDTCPTCSDVSTNATGVPTLDLLANNSAESAIVFDNGTDSLQLGITGAGGGPTPFDVINQSSGDFADVAPFVADAEDTGIEVTGIEAVPEPVTSSLLGLGLVGLASRRWRRP
jgi:hypothetical protein